METIAQPSVWSTPGAPSPALRDGLMEIEGRQPPLWARLRRVEDVSLTIRPGEKIGVVGRSGAGKSTLVKLMLRFYDTESGAILIDGQNIGDVTQESLRQKIGMVQQDSAPAPVVRDNILYGRPDASEAEMIAAAQRRPRRMTSS
jgi:ATP-binding cassette subfamily B multidrug efflux pump